jgi:hypothetical protein
MRKIILSIFLALVITLNTACSQVFSQIITPLRGNSSITALTIDQIRKSDNPGQFMLSGKADLPEQTELTISAIRRLTLLSNDKPSDTDQLYGILDRKTTLVKNGNWQAELSLWEINSEGYYQENWQANEGEISDRIEPDQTINFLLTVEPEDFVDYTTNFNPNKLNDQLSDLIRFTPEGESYLSASKDLPVPLPQKVKASRLDLPQAPDVSWQNRTLLDPTKTSIEQPTELPFIKEDNLPLSSDSLMR